MQTHVGDGLAVDDDAATCRLDDAEQRQGQGRLSGARPAHDAHLVRMTGALLNDVTQNNVYYQTGERICTNLFNYRSKKIQMHTM